MLLLSIGIHSIRNFNLRMGPIIVFLVVSLTSLTPSIFAPFLLSNSGGLCLRFGCGFLHQFPSTLGQTSQITVMIASYLQVQQNNINDTRVGLSLMVWSQGGPFPPSYCSPLMPAHLTGRKNCGPKVLFLGSIPPLDILLGYRK